MSRRSLKKLSVASKPTRFLVFHKVVGLNPRQLHVRTARHPTFGPSAVVCRISSGPTIARAFGATLRSVFAVRLPMDETTCWSVKYLFVVLSALWDTYLAEGAITTTAVPVSNMQNMTLRDHKEPDSASEFKQLGNGFGNAILQCFSSLRLRRFSSLLV